ncbi:MAG: hypothetical protein M9947_09360 [Thermomicrobiales bacterium]|nr:hypothetical protein [Thermomicrobiales bacterium]
MDPNRFDSFAKKLGSRLSRRDMMRASAGVAVGAIAVNKFTSVAAQDADTTAKDRFISVRTYAYSGTESDAASGLNGLIPVMEQQPGFIEYNLVFGDGQILAISTFLDETTAVAAAQQEDAWIAGNAANILSGIPTIQSGDVLLRSELHAGCGCITGTDDACHSSRLTCCATTDAMGGPGICLTNETTCPGAAPAEPTEVPPPAPTEEPACTGEGCDCNGGVQDACDDGLVCCGVTMPGGPGTCMTEEECDPAPTEVPACTSEGCDCTAGTEGACDDGLCCTGADTPGGTGTCSSDCGDGGCTGDGCACTTGVDGNCDSGLVCCAADMTDPGSPGTCMASCDSSDCNGQENCPCTSGTESPCQDGLECCGADEPGGTGTCLASC